MNSDVIKQIVGVVLGLALVLVGALVLKDNATAQLAIISAGIGLITAVTVPRPGDISSKDAIKLASQRPPLGYEVDVSIPPDPKTPRVTTDPKDALNRLVLFFVVSFALVPWALAGATACAGTGGAKPVIRSVDAIAQELCSRFFAEKRGISVEDAAKAACKAREDYAPWIDPILAAQQEGAVRAGAAQP